MKNQLVYGRRIVGKANVRLEITGPAPAMAEASPEAIRIFLDVEDELVDSSRTDRSCVRKDFAAVPLTFRWRLPNHSWRRPMVDMGGG